MTLSNPRRLLPLLLLLFAPVAIWGGIVLRRPQAVATEEARLRVTVLNVGQGESTLIQTPGGGTVLIGAGSTESGSDVVEALQDAGVKRIDILILPYPYAEAIGGVPDLFTAFEIKTIWEPGGELINAHATNALRLARDYQVPWRNPPAGYSVTFPRDGVKVEVLAPSQIQPRVGATDNSLVIAVHYKETRFLFAGGVGRRGERALLAGTPELRAQWLRVARSGSDEASSLEFLRQVMPEYAVISVGPNGDGFPGNDTLRRLRATGAKIYRTDENGGQSLIFESDGREVTQGNRFIRAK